MLMRDVVWTGRHNGVKARIVIQIPDCEYTDQPLGDVAELMIGSLQSSIPFFEPTGRLYDRESFRLEETSTEGGAEHEDRNEDVQG